MHGVVRGIWQRPDHHVNACGCINNSGTSHNNNLISYTTTRAAIIVELPFTTTNDVSL